MKSIKERAKDVLDKFKQTDSIREGNKLLREYLRLKLKIAESIIANEFPDDVILEDLISDMFEDLALAKDQLSSDAFALRCNSDEKDN